VLVQHLAIVLHDVLADSHLTLRRAVADDFASGGPTPDIKLDEENGLALLRQIYSHGP
jgi:hypothetical protein